MVQMMSTTRAGRPSKEKTPKSQHTQHTKSEGGGSSGASNKHQPTPEQLRLAQMVKSSEKGMDDPDLEEKIKQVAECTGRTHDDAYFALHDCDYDLSRAIEKLLENQDQGEWQEKKTKKKKQAAAKAEAETVSQNQDPKPDREERSNDRDHNDYNSGGYERSSSAPRGRRNDRAPPRFQRAAAGRGKNDDDRGDGSQRGERGRGRGRGSRGRGSRRGGGGAPRRDYDNRADAFSNGPQIDTWTNETADTKQESSFGTWGDMSEDWNNDEWTGSLKESKVFTPSAQDSSKVFSSNDNDAKMFSVSSIETQVFNSSAIGDSLSSGGPSMNDSGSRYQHTASPLHHQPHSLDPMSQQDPLGPPQSLGQDPLGPSLAQKPIGQNALGQSTIGQNTLGQRLDLGMLLGTKTNDSASSVTRQTEELAKQTADFISQFQKQATEQIKSAVGIGNSSQTGSMGLSGPAPDPSVVMSQASQPAASSLPSSLPPQEQRTPIGPAPGLGQAPTMVQAPGMGQAPGQVNTSQQAALQQRAKPQRTKLPPPSKIPQSAVVMPGGMSFGGDLGVKFGTWDGGDPPSGFSFTAAPQSTAGVSFSTSSATSSLNSHMPGSGSQANHISTPQSQQAPSQQVTQQQSVANAKAVGESQTPTTPASTSLPAPSSVSAPQNAVTSPANAAAVSAMLDSMTQQVQQQQVSQSPRPGSQSMYQPTAQKPTPSTPPKADYSQSTKISSPPEPIPFPPSSQTDRKSPYQPSGSLASDSAGASQQLSYSQSSNSYSSAYNANAYKPSVPSTVSSGTNSQYAPQSNSLSGTGLSDYRNQSSAFKSASQSSYNGQGQNSLYANSTNAPNSFQSSQNVSYQSGGGYQSQTSYHNRDSQSAPAFQTSGVSQSGSSYQNSVSQSSGPNYQRDSESSQSAYGTGQSAYGSASSSQKISGTKLSDSLGKLTVKDSSSLGGSSDQNQSQFDSSNVGTSSGLTSSVVSNTNTALTTSASVSIASGPVSVSAVLGLTTPTANNVSSVTGGNSTTLSSLQMSKSNTATVTSATTKAPPNLPPGVPPINYMPVGQHGFPIATAFGLQQPPMYSYEDLLLSHQRLPMHNYYDNLPFQPTPTTMTMSGVDHSKLAPTQGMAYNTAAPDANKLNRVDAQSPTNSQTNQQSQVPQTQSTAHGQTQFINHPHSIPPGYAAPSYYYPMQPGPTGYTYPPMIPLNNLMTQVTNAGASSASNQFPKATYGFGSGTATQDYNKAFMGTSQTQSKGSVSAASSISSTSDLSAASGYAKTHNQAFDKSGFAAGTPPPFNMTGLATGTQAGSAAMGAPAYVHYVPGLAAAQPGAQQMLAHQLQQDTMGSNSRGTQQTSTQGKSLANKSGYGATAYWGTN